MKTKLKFVSGSPENFPGIECGDGRMLLLDCAEGPGDAKFLKRLAFRYNMFDKLANLLKGSIRSEICPYCGRDNENCLAGCTADDCLGAGLLKKLKEHCDEA